jgi:hypothetical protein
MDRNRGEIASAKRPSRRANTAREALAVFVELGHELRLILDQKSDCGFELRVC